MIDYSNSTTYAPFIEFVRANGGSAFTMPKYPLMFGFSVSDNDVARESLDSKGCIRESLAKLMAKHFDAEILTADYGEFWAGYGLAPTTDITSTLEAFKPDFLVFSREWIAFQAEYASWFYADLDSEVKVPAPEFRPSCLI